MPVSVQDLDLADVRVPPVSARYEKVWFLVRLRGIPIGYLKVRNRGADLRPGALVWAAASKLQASIWGEYVGQTLFAHGSASDGDGRPPGVSVVVCTRDRPDELEGCLAALAAQRYPPYEVIVVDNASRDEATRRVAARWSARYVREPRPGLDWARNCGLAASRAPIVAFTDDDARPDAGWLAALAAGFVSPDVHAVTGLVVPAELETRAQVLFEDAYGGMGKGFRLRIHSRRGRVMKYTATNYGSGCNMAFRRETLERVGGFDTALDVGAPTGGGGDAGVLQRVVEEDAAIQYRPDAIVRHIHRRTERQLRRQLFDNGRGYGAVLCAALLRTRGLERLRVVVAFVTWFYWWFVRRPVRRVLRRERIPLPLIAVELCGALLAPFFYAKARRRARRLARAAPEGPF